MISFCTAGTIRRFFGSVGSMLAVMRFRFLRSPSSPSDSDSEWSSNTCSKTSHLPSGVTLTDSPSSSSPTFSRIAFMKRLCSSPSNGAGALHTGHRQEGLRMLQIRYGSRSKHCTCLHAPPVTGVSMNVCPSGHISDTVVCSCSMPLSDDSRIFAKVCSSVRFLVSACKKYSTGRHCTALMENLWPQTQDEDVSRREFLPGCTTSVKSTPKFMCAPLPVRATPLPLTFSVMPEGSLQLLVKA
mmetsp:Transcript_1006/g.3608  ORF Transcript_1006/g.3608 Transcript_1006/m.3608 type:complete len:242 (-) Transcript_1006:889-1614(-)